MKTEPETLQRIRLCYEKQKSLKYTGSLDLQRIWERSFRRGEIALAYSQGFHPQPRIQQAAPLPLGFFGRAELLDCWINCSDNPSEIIMKLSSALPDGLLIANYEVTPLKQQSLPSQVLSAFYQVTSNSENKFSFSKIAIQELLDRDSIIRTRRGKEYDLRPLIISLSIDHSSLQMLLSATENATGRPDEVISTLKLDPFAFSYERLGLILKQTT